MKHLLVAAIASLAALPARAEDPRLIVLISVDQMRADYLERYGRDWSGGLRRIMDEGAWFRAASYPYSHTVTCAGHATLGTGTVPATHGMVLNAWYERETGRTVTCTWSDDLRNLGADGESPQPWGDGPARLLVPTLADVLRLDEDARVASLSIKARSAIAMAGRGSDLVLWMEGDGRWATSTAYAAAFPRFLAPLAREHSPAAAVGEVWRRARPADSYSFEDDASWEQPPGGWSTTFPHAIGSGAPAGERSPAQHLADQWKCSPFADEALVELALAAVGELELGTRGRTDFLAVGFSPLDTVGHSFGPHSQEVEDLLLRLDVSLGRLLDGLDRMVGAGRYALALSADHGVSPVPERVLARGLDAGRVSAVEIAARVQAVLVASLGEGSHVASASYSDLYFAPGVYDRLLEQPALMARVEAELLRVPGVERVIRREQLSSRAAADPALLAHALSFHPARSGDMVLSWKPFWIASTSAATHGTARDYDRRVPVLLMGHGVRPGRYLQPATPADIAPTLAFLAGVTLPQPDGRVLSEALAGD